ncbi:MAG: esterase-like activity of phytase family protein [Geminicoccaceae bacterium]
MTIDYLGRRGLAAALTTTALATAAMPAVAAGPYFERVATLPVYATLPAGADPKTPTSAEIITATPDGNTLIFTDSPGRRLGFVDITDPAAPAPARSLPLGGEPTSVTVVGGVVLAAVNSSASKAAPTGHVAVIDLAERSVAATCDVHGQPDSVAASPDRRFLAVAVENERDEELNDGTLPQLPAGHLAVFDLGADGRPTNCDAARIVAMTGMAEVAPEDPEPEFVDINADNIAAVTLQENNHVALVDLATGQVTGHFPAGAVDLERIDADGDKVIAGTGARKGVRREPDAIGWLGTDRLVTANEGDYEGGSRGFTIFDTAGKVLHDSGSLLEHLGMSYGHYPVKRAKAKGVEPEGVEIGTFGGTPLIFINAERGNFLAVFADRGASEPPELLQFLPTGISPEGVVAIPGRDLIAVANELDEPEDNVRATIGIYRRDAAVLPYPSVASVTDPATGAPIGWGAMSGLAADPSAATTLYAVSDSYYDSSRIYTLDTSVTPALITSFVELKKDGEQASYDLEGVALRAGGGFWAASEGNPESKNPLTRQNLLLAVAPDGTVEQEIALPEALAGQAVRFGFEGVATWGEGAGQKVILAVQRPWQDDPKGMAKLAVYDPATAGWAFVHYPLSEPQSPAGGWVGLSEITALGGDRFALIERDNQQGADATLKTITVISLEGVEPKPLGQTLPVVEKKVAIDVLPAMRQSNGWISDKLEGFAVMANGQLVAVTDNDGVDGATGETLFLRLDSAALVN